MAEYLPPVNQLLKLGEPDKEWRDYASLGLACEHAPELIGLLTDRELNFGAFVEPQGWAPNHAWRALAQLGATQAARPFLELTDELVRDESANDLILDEAGAFFEKLGPGAVPALTEFLHDAGREAYSRWSAATGLARLGQRHPELREEVVGTLMKALERPADTGFELNSGIIIELVNLKAAEAAPLITRAYEGDHVGQFFVGTLPWVLYQLGAGPRPPDDEPRIPLSGSAAPGDPGLDPRLVGDPVAHGKKKAKNRAKNKAAAKARKRNRKKR